MTVVYHDKGTEGMMANVYRLLDKEMAVFSRSDGGNNE